MRLLLDTHALLWWFTDDPRLSVKALALITLNPAFRQFEISTLW